MGGLEAVLFPCLDYAGSIRCGSLNADRVILTVVMKTDRKYTPRKAGCVYVFFFLSCFLEFAGPFQRRGHKEIKNKKKTRLLK